MLFVFFAAFFFQNKLFQKFFQETLSVSPDLGSEYTKVINRRQKSPLARKELAVT